MQDIGTYESLKHAEREDVDPQVGHREGGRGPPGRTQRGRTWTPTERKDIDPPPGTGPVNRDTLCI